MIVNAFSGTVLQIIKGATGIRGDHMKIVFSCCIWSK